MLLTHLHKRRQAISRFKNTVLHLRNTNGTIRQGARATLLARLGNSWTAQGRLLVQNIDGAPLIARVPDNLPSQFLRRKVAEALNLQDRWDWGAYLGLNEIQSTIHRIRPEFEKLSQ